jgi:hypothetical protein
MTSRRRIDLDEARDALKEEGGRISWQDLRKELEL